MESVTCKGHVLVFTQNEAGFPEVGVGMGITVGLVKGIMHTVGRTVVGVVELVTFFIPSKDFIEPRYVWEPFEKDTTYGSKKRCPGIVSGGAGPGHFFILPCLGW